MWIKGGWGEHHSEMPEMRPVSLPLPSYSSSVFANFQPVQTSCDFWVRNLTRCWQHILLLLINPFTPKILVSFFFPVNDTSFFKFQLEQSRVKSDSFRWWMFNSSSLLVILESERAKRPLCFFFFICFWEIISRSTCRFSSVNHQHQWTSYCQDFWANTCLIWDRLTCLRKEPAEKKKKEPVNDLLLPYPPPQSPSAPFPWLEYPFMTPWIINGNHVPVKLVVKG